MPVAVLVDIGVILVLLLSAGVSFFRGAIREILTIFGVMGGAVAALLFGGALKPITQGWFGVKEGEDTGKIFDLIPADLAADIAAYALIFVGVFVLLQLASHFLASSAHALGLGPIDRTLGVFFGLARGVIILGLIYLPFHLILPENSKKEWLADSKTMFYVENISEWMASYLPQDKGDTESIGENAREKLRDIDVLGDKRIAPLGSKEKNEAQSAPAEPANSGGAQEGYGETDRNRMESLIDQLKTEDTPAAGQKTGQKPDQTAPGGLND